MFLWLMVYLRVKETITHLSIRSSVTFGINFEVGCKINHLKATLIGVVKHAVNKSAGRSGFIGRT